MNIKDNILKLGKNAKKASVDMKLCSSDQKNVALRNLIKNIYQECN